MTEPISAQQFHESEGVEDWRVLDSGACAHFRTGSFATGLLFVNAIGELAEAANHHPDVDLRYQGVTVRLWTHSVDGLSGHDVNLARQISAAARRLGIPADPSGVQDVRVSIEVMAAPAMVGFWRALLGYRQVGGQDLLDPKGRGPSFSFRQLAAPRRDRNRIRVDVSVAHDQAGERVAAALAAGGSLLDDHQAPSRWTLADPEGNEVDIVTWMGRD